MLDERIYESYIGILKEEMVPAMGCTEPIALAYGAARAREVFGKRTGTYHCKMQWKHYKKCPLCYHSKLRRIDWN